MESGKLDEESSLLLYIQQRIPATLSYGKPWEVYFNGVTISDLRDLVSQHFEIPKESLQMAKFVRHNCTWQVLNIQVETPVENAPNKKKNPGNVRTKPYSLRDGGNKLKIEHY
jgi:hypothetical protein